MRIHRELLVLATLVTACGTPPEGPGPLAPASEPRGILRLGVDLPRAQRCEESFDLAAYANPGIELITWDDNEGRCRDRVIAVRYLPRRISAGAVQALITSLATRAEVLPTEGEKKP